MSKPPKMTSATDAGDRNEDGTFAKGKSGNPKGRPKLSHNFVTLFNKKRDELVRLKTPEGEVEMPRMEAWITNTWNNAIKGDGKANNNVLAILRATGQLQPEQNEDEELDTDAQAVVEGFIARALKKLRGGDDDE